MTNLPNAEGSTAAWWQTQRQLVTESFPCLLQWARYRQWLQWCSMSFSHWSELAQWAPMCITRGGRESGTELRSLPCSFFAHPHLTLALPYIPTYKSARVYLIHEGFPKNNLSLPITLNMHSTERCHCRRLETQKPSVLLSNVHSQWNSTQVCQENNVFASLLFF